jgi:ERCC4-type nuclease
MSKSHFQIIVDTREQLPLQFDPEFEVVRQKLEFGDYAMRMNNCILPVVFERKSLGDLFGTMTSGYKRFKAEYHRCNGVGHKMVLLLESSMREVAGGYEHSQFEGSSMIKKLAMLEVRYGIQVVYGGDRYTCSRYIQEIFGAIWRNWKRP